MMKRESQAAAVIGVWKQPTSSVLACCVDFAWTGKRRTILILDSASAEGPGPLAAPLQRRVDGEGGFAWTLTGQQDEVGLWDREVPELSFQLISRSWGLCLKRSQFCGAGLGLWASQPCCSLSCSGGIAQSMAQTITKSVKWSRG